MSEGTTIIERVKNCVAHVACMDEAKIKDSDTLQSLELDSLAYVELLMELEGEFDIEIAPSVEDQLEKSSVTELAAFIKDQRRKVKT